MPVTGVPGCCAVVPLEISSAPVEVNEESEDAVSVVNAPVEADEPPIGVELIVDAVIVLLDTFCVSVVPRISPVGAVLDVDQADPVETGIPAPG